MEIGYFFIAIMICFILVLILQELKKLEKKIEHPDDKPHNEKRWGYGKSKK